jgi:hypothetical protein
VRALTLVLGNNQRLVAQLLLSALVLSQPLYSVYLTLSHATLNAFALVLVVKIVVALLFAFASGEEEAAPVHARGFPHGTDARS